MEENIIIGIGIIVCAAQISLVEDKCCPPELLPNELSHAKQAKKEREESKV